MLRFTEPSQGVWRFNLFSSDKLSMLFHVWLPLHLFISEGTFFLNPDPDYTVTSPGNVIIPMVVTAYDHKNGSIYINASRGYTRDNFIVPSFAAPGVNLVVPSFRNTYVTATGTSLAAAHTAGIAALFLEWGNVDGKYPRISTVQIKNFLIRGAIRGQKIPYPNKVWGYGVIDVYNSYTVLGTD
jgi:subtilisin family serine protease